MNSTLDWDFIRSIGTLVIAIISLALAVFTLYLAQFKNPDIKMSLARRIRIGGTGGGGFQIYAPITFANNSHRPGNIERIIVLLVTQTSKRYLFELSRISELDSEGKKFVDKSIAGTFPVLGKTSSQAVFRFVWWDETVPKFELEGWENEIIVCAWTSVRKKPELVCRSKFIIEGSTYEKVKHFQSSNVLYEISASGNSLKNTVIDDKQLSEYI